MAATPFYANTPTTFNWIDPVAGGHTAVTWSNGASCQGGTYFGAALDDDITAQIPLGFTYNFGGTNYTQLQINVNGRVQFANSYCGYGTQTVGPPPTYPFDIPTGLPSVIGAANLSGIIRIYGADFDAGGSLPGGRVYFATTGTAPNRSFVVTWYNIKEWNSPGSLFNMQIILRENGEFVFQYKDTVNITTGRAQIGWEVSPADFDIYTYSGFGSLAYSAIRFYPAPTKIGEWRMDEPSWAGVAGEAIDTSGNNRNAQAVNGAATAVAAPAISTNPGTCRYGVFDGVNDHVLLPGTFPNLTQSFTITAWIRSQDRSKVGQRVFVDDETNTGGYGLSLGDGGAGILRFYSRSTSPVVLDTPAIIQNNLWYFVAAVADIAGGTKTLYVYDASGALLTSVTSAFTGAWGTDAGAASIGGETNASAESAFRFFGNLDEVKVLSGAVPQSTLDILARETHLCPVSGVTLGGFNVFESSTTAGLAAGYIKTKTAGRRFDTTTGNLAIVALAAGAIDAAFTGTVKVEVLNASAGGPLDSNGCNAAWPVVATLANQNVSGGRINMNPIPQINGAAYPNLKIRVSFPAVGAVTRYGCSNDGFALRPDSLVANNATHANWQASGAGPALNNLGVAGGQVHKAGRKFTVSATARDALGAVIANYAGSPAGGISALQLPSGCGACVPGILTPNSFTAAAGTVTSHDATYSEAGAFTMQLEDRSFADIDLADSSIGERYVDSNPVGVGRFVPDHFDVAVSVAPVFRTFNVADAACSAGLAPRRTFTYIGQRFGYATPPQTTIIARNFANATTVNYRGPLWKLGSGAGAPNAAACTASTCTLNSSVGTTTFSNAYTFVLNPAVATGWDTAVPVTGIPSVASNNDGTGILSFTTSDQLAFSRPLTPVNDFTATIGLSLALADVSEGAAQTIATASPAIISAAIAFDAPYTPTQPNRFFYGRLRIANANGSERLPLTMRMTTQYYSATAGFVDNTADNCTTILSNNIGLGNYLLNLNAGETVASVAPGAFAGGAKNLTLSAPGANNFGSVDVVVDLGTPLSTCIGLAPVPAPTSANLDYLRDQQFCSAGSYNRDPTSRATFGAYDVNRNFIYLRENY